MIDGADSDGDSATSVSTMSRLRMRFEEDDRGVRLGRRRRRRTDPATKHECLGIQVELLKIHLGFQREEEVEQPTA